jgi:hypothetical protein
MRKDVKKTCCYQVSNYEYKKGGKNKAVSYKELVKKK